MTDTTAYFAHLTIAIDPARLDPFADQHAGANREAVESTSSGTTTAAYGDSVDPTSSDMPARSARPTRYDEFLDDSDAWSSAL